ncbi:MAG: PEP-CTERM sorting domain-containing protein [Terriglobia bacterium]
MSKKNIIGIAVAAALALGASGVALATPVNVDGVVFDPAQTNNPILQSINFRESSVSSTSPTLTGYGVIASLNGVSPVNVPPGIFCPGCSLTFTFTYTYLSPPPGAPANLAEFTNGTINFYVVPDSANSGTGFQVSNPSSATYGKPWLTLSGKTIPLADLPQPQANWYEDGQLYAQIFGGSVSSPGNGSSGFGYLDVTGGTAGKYFKTGSQLDGTDLFLNSSFQVASGNNICQAGICYPIAGQGGLTGLLMMPVAVPEPGELGLLGLGLGMLGFFGWRRRKEAEEKA